MSSDPRNEKAITVGSSSTNVEFTDFESVLAIDTDGAGLTIEDENGNSASWPTGIPLSIGGPGPKASSYIKITGTFTYLLYQ